MQKLQKHKCIILAYLTIKRDADAELGQDNTEAEGVKPAVPVGLFLRIFRRLKLEGKPGGEHYVCCSLTDYGTMNSSCLLISMQRHTHTHTPSPQTAGWACGRGAL